MIRATQMITAVLRLHEDGGVEERAPLSLLYTAMPESLKRRIPEFRSLRQTASSYSKESRHTRSDSDSSLTTLGTPPPSYPGSNRASLCVSDLDALAIPSTASSRPQSSSSANSSAGDDAYSGVNWKFAAQGQALLSLSTQEAESLSRNARFSRKLYIDSLQYLLSGLPADLSEQEEIGLKASLPDSLTSKTAMAETGVVARTPSIDEPDVLPRRRTEPSTLHHVVANIIVYIFLAAAFIMPYLQLLLQEVYRYDRKHKISDKLLAQSVVTVDVVAKQTLLLANNVCQMQDGRVGMALRDVGVWWVQGVTGGVYDGVGEGMQAIGLRLATDDKNTTRTAQ